ncbi:acyl-CoA N-acyltransferase [Trichoderma citrinoviride]|uniref:Acyl-CoA N-acyltransferase n=1 Tax=Trichoderma citrinoviride TaxID=58853 RepID=A0A2T4B7J3_9HYPO|nr:acyl-CoA N-acyltransferase [Trichoderma citrinoviride]PTB65258.1 acyl-CoA N-acyltransferase [Trichoderma citrinoviride]
MAIVIRKATEQDIPHIAALAGRAFHPTTDWLTRQIFPLHLQPNNIPDGEAALPWRISRKTAILRSPNTASIVAIDTSAPDNQIVGFALWDLPAGDEETKQQQQMVTAAEAELPAAVTDLKAYAELQAILKEDCRATFGDRELKDVWHLDFIGVDPKHQRKGIGKALLSWGVEQATKAGRDCYLMATPQGRPLYEAAGFEVVRPLDMFGVMHHSMILRTKHVNGTRA